jgi:hypothetical protein
MITGKQRRRDEADALMRQARAGMEKMLERLSPRNRGFYRQYVQLWQIEAKTITVS